MSLSFNGTEMKNISFNGTALKRVFFNGVLVFNAVKPLQVQNKTIKTAAAGGGGFAIRGNGATGLFARAGAGEPYVEGAQVNVIDSGNFGSGISDANQAGAFTYRLRLELLSTGLRIQIANIVGTLYSFSAVLPYTKEVGFPSTTVVTGSDADHKLELQGSGFSFRIRYSFGGVANAYSDWMTITEV